MCLRTLKPIVRTQWTVLPLLQVLVSFINKLREADEKDMHIGQAPVFFRGGPDVEATDRAPARLQDMPGVLVVEYLRDAFITPFCASRTQEEDEDIDVYEPEPEVQEEVHELEAEVEEKPPVYIYLSQ